MSKTRIEDALRLAIYEAYKGKCFYTEMPVSYLDFEVDHIIPESLASDLENIKNRLNLNDDFHINSVENLVPCRPGINLRKNGDLFSDETLLFYFERTRKQGKNVVALYEKYKKQSRRGNGYKAIDKILAAGTISLTEIKDYIHWKVIEQWRNKCITLHYPIWFADGAIREVTVDDDHENFLMKSLELFGNGRGVDLITDNDERVEVHSLLDWKNYTNKGFYPITNADIRMSGAFEYLDGLLTALNAAQMPKLSFVEGLSMKDLAGRLSASMLIDIEHDLPDVTVGELVNEGKAEISVQEDNSVCVRYNGFLNTFSEQFRADLTKDGIENIFCYVWRNADGGSMGWGKTIILGCHSQNGVIKEERPGKDA